jgi:transcription elongation factor Elf1
MTYFTCNNCGDEVAMGRAQLGYAVCLPCGDYTARQVKRTVAPLNKSNYMLISNLEELKQLNPKRTT